MRKFLLVIGCFTTTVLLVATIIASRREKGSPLTWVLGGADIGVAAVTAAVWAWWDENEEA